MLSYAHCTDTALISIPQMLFIGMTSMHQQCQSQITHILYVHVGLSRSLPSPDRHPPLCSGPRIKSFISFALLSPLLLSPSLCLYSLLFSACPPLSLSLIHRLQLPKENEPATVSSSLARRDRSSFCFVFFTCLFMPSIRFLIMTLPRNRSHMFGDLNGVWSGIGTLPPHTHTH